MATSLRMNLSWLGRIVAAFAVIFLLGLEMSTASVAQGTTTLSAPLAESDHVHSAEHRGGGNAHHDNEGTNSSCCGSAACSSPGMMSAMAALFVIPIATSYRAVPLGRLIPFEQSPSERPPRAA